jgi:hypothetical protein
MTMTGFPVQDNPALKASVQDVKQNNNEIRAIVEKRFDFNE